MDHLTEETDTAISRRRPKYKDTAVFTEFRDRDNAAVFQTRIKRCAGDLHDLVIRKRPAPAAGFG
ncbi:MAG: hypothetical protein AAGF82_19265 [Pseudomonadota bacterium]